MFSHPPGRKTLSTREPEEGVHTASRSVEHVARSMPASACRTLWTVAKPKTPMVAVRWRERWRSVPNLSLAVPNPKVVLRALVPHQKSTILKLGPQGSSLSSGRRGPSCPVYNLFLRRRAGVSPVALSTRIVPGPRIFFSHHGSLD